MEFTSTSVRSGWISSQLSVVPSVTSTSTPATASAKPQDSSGRWPWKRKSPVKASTPSPVVTRYPLAPGTSWSTSKRSTVIGPTRTASPSPIGRQSVSPANARGPGSASRPFSSAFIIAIVSGAACTGISGRTKPTRPTWSMCGWVTNSAVGSTCSPSRSPAASAVGSNRPGIAGAAPTRSRSASSRPGRGAAGTRNRSPSFGMSRPRSSRTR